MSRGFHENLSGPGGSVYMSEHLDKTVNALSLNFERLDFERPYSILTMSFLFIRNFNRSRHWQLTPLWVAQHLSA
jgi:hypothetical protein